jgi:hypothetical protein
MEQVCARRRLIGDGHNNLHHELRGIARHPVFAGFFVGRRIANGRPRALRDAPQGPCTASTIKASIIIGPMQTLHPATRSSLPTTKM